MNLRHRLERVEQRVQQRAAALSGCVKEILPPEMYDLLYATIAAAGDSPLPEEPPVPELTNVWKQRENIHKLMRTLASLC